jgi:hypothetical protein
MTGRTQKAALERFLAVYGINTHRIDRYPDRRPRHRLTVDYAGRRLVVSYHAQDTRPTLYALAKLRLAIRERVAA